MAAKKCQLNVIEVLLAAGGNIKDAVHVSLSRLIQLINNNLNNNNNITNMVLSQLQSMKTHFCHVLQKLVESI